jgi:outer membrane protein OmpA-like peptidoglycan-associated protein
MPFRIAVLCLLVALCSAPAFAAKDTISVFFASGKSTLTEEYRKVIDKAIFNDVISEAENLQIIGYTDEVGSEQSNLRLSKERAGSIKDYLIASGFRPERIILIMGKGEAVAQRGTGPGGNLTDRRVDIVKGDPVPKQSRPPVVTTFVKSGEPTRLSTTDLGKVSAGQRIILDRIYFYAGEHIVRKESADALEMLYSSLTTHPKVRIKIEGHVCCISPSTVDALDEGTHRLELSINRARAIRDYLVDRGISADRIEYAGYGRKYPIVPIENNEEDADKNRRVEIRVIE